MTLPLIIAPNDPGHIDDHQEIHTLLGRLDGQSTLLAAGSAVGNFASRPAAGPGTLGSFYRASDVPALYFGDGALWHQTVLATAANTFTAINEFEDDVFFESGKPFCSVAAKGAVLDGVADDSGPFQLAVDDMELVGGIVWIDYGTLRCASKVTVNAATYKQVTIAGVGFNSVIQGTGITVLECTDPEGLIIRDVRFFDPTGHANTVLLNIENGTYPTGGTSTVGLHNVTFWGNYNLAHGSRLGIGLRMPFVLKAQITNCHFEYLNRGVYLRDAANANCFVGCKIRSNNTGMFVDMVAATVDNLFLYGCTFENNVLGLRTYGSNVMAFGCHFEDGPAGYASLSSCRCVTVEQGSFHAVGGGFYGAGAYQIEVAGGSSACSVGSLTLNNGTTAAVLHNGTGTFEGEMLLAGPTFAGTGPLIYRSGNSMTTRNVSGLNHTLSTGFNAAVLDSLNILWGNSLQITQGAGSPEGSVTAPIGSIYCNRTGGAGTTLYVKQSGAGNTGWSGLS